MRLVQALAVVIVLTTVPVPVVAQTETALCLKVQAAADRHLPMRRLSRRASARARSSVTDVIPCDATTAPVSSATPASDVGTGAWIVRANRGRSNDGRPASPGLCHRSERGLL